MTRSLLAKVVFVCGALIILLSYQNCSNSVVSQESGVASLNLNESESDLSSDEDRIINGFSAAERNPLLRKSVVEVIYPVQELSPIVMVKYQNSTDYVELSESEFVDIVEYITAFMRANGNSNYGTFLPTKFRVGGGKCSGTMLSSERVITAAHCIIEPNKWVLMAGQSVKEKLDGLTKLINILKTNNFVPLGSDSQTIKLVEKIKDLQDLQQKTETIFIDGIKIEMPVFRELVIQSHYLPNVFINFNDDIMKTNNSINPTFEMNTDTKVAHAIAIYQHPRYIPDLNAHDIGLIFLEKNNEIALSNPNYVSRPQNSAVDLKQVNINKQLYINKSNLNLQVAGFGLTGADRSNILNFNKPGKLNFMPFPIADITSSDTNVSIKSSIYRDFVGFLDPVASLVKNYPDPHKLIEGFNIDRTAMYRVSPIGRSAYHGDSGGPLYSQKIHGGQMSQYGVVSWGNITSDANLKGGFGSIWLFNDDDWNWLNHAEDINIQTQDDPYDSYGRMQINENECVRFKLASTTQNVNLNINSTPFRTYLFFSNLIKYIDKNTTWNVDLNSFSGDAFSQNYKEYIGEATSSLFFTMSDSSKLILRADAYKIKNQKILDEIAENSISNIKPSSELLDQSEKFIVVLNLQNLKKTDINFSVVANGAGVSEVYIKKSVGNNLLAKIAFPTSLAPRISHNALYLSYLNSDGSRAVEGFYFENMNIDFNSGVIILDPSEVIVNLKALDCGSTAESSQPLNTPAPLAPEQSSLTQLRRVSMDFKTNKFKKQLINRALLHRKVNNKI